MTSLTVHALTVTLDGHTIVDGVDATVPTGSWLGVIGPNGAGKSTMLRATAGLLSFGGEVRIGDWPVQTLSPRQRARLVAYAPQVPVLPDGLTVFDYVLLGRTPHLGYLAREGRADRQIAASALERLDLASFADRTLGTLSGGEQRRVVLARALAQQASVLLLDEPTTALDIGHQQQVLELVDRLRIDDGLTVVTTLHDLTLAGQYADTLLLLAGGRTVARGTATEVLTEETIGTHYGATVQILPGRDGHPVIHPMR